MLWVAGFDLFYSLFDLDHDRAEGLHSWAVRFGERGVFLGARRLPRRDDRAARCLRAPGSTCRSSTGSVCRDGGAACLRALDRAARRPATARHRVLHAQRRHQPRVLLLRRVWTSSSRDSRTRRREAVRSQAGGARAGRCGPRRRLRRSSPARTEAARRRCCACSRASRARRAASSSSGSTDRASATSRTSHSSTGSSPPSRTSSSSAGSTACRRRRERIGMLLERFSLWEARNERVSTYSRGMTQRLALCRTLLHDPDLLVLDEPYSALDEAGARRSSTASSRRWPVRERPLSSRRTIRCVSRRSRRRSSRSRDLSRRRRRADAQGPPRRAPRPRHAARDAPLRPLDARRLPLRSPGGVGRHGRVRAALGRDRVHRARSDSHARGYPSRSTACSTVSSSRRATAARSGSARRSRRSRSCSRPRRSRCRRSSLFFEPLDATALAGVLLADIGICAVGSLMSAMAAAGRSREVLLPLLVLPLAIPLVVGGVGAAVSAEAAALPALPRSSTTRVFAVLSWASFEYVVTE